MHQERIKSLTSEEFIKIVIVTGLKEDILQQIPCLCEKRDRKHVIFTIEENVGKALLEYSQCYFKDIIIAKAARIIGRFLFSKEEICDALRDLVRFVQFKNVKNTHGGVSILVKFQASACNFTKIYTPLWVFFTFLNCANGTKLRNAPHMKYRFTCGESNL